MVGWSGPGNRHKGEASTELQAKRNGKAAEIQQEERKKKTTTDKRTRTIPDKSIKLQKSRDLLLFIDGLLELRHHLRHFVRQFAAISAGQVRGAPY